LRWYRGTPVVLIRDEACFCFENFDFEKSFDKAIDFIFKE